MPRWTAPFCLPALGLLALLASPLPSRAEPAPAACAASDAFTTPEDPLEHVGAAIAAGGPVNILAIGSATTVGDQLGADRNSAFPYRMVEALHAALPNVPFALTLRGGRGMTAEDMLPLLQAALTARHYQLVLWQTGTVEAVRGVRPDGMVAALQEGIDHARDAGADVVLIDPQFSRFLRANADLDPYEAALQQVSAMPEVVLFRRFDVMRGWAEDGTIDLERARQADRARMMALLNTCLGETLAHFVLNGAGAPAP
jgi:acyl-CoA thioesterase-1